MSTSNEPSSETAAKRSSDHSVFDFLYNDSRRVASFLAQFEGGHLTQMTKSNKVTESSGEQSGREFSMGVTRVLGGGSKSSESEGTAAEEGLVRSFDPYWRNARAFLDFVSDRDLIQRDIWEARMGQFVLVSGRLAILNLASMEKIWSMPVFKELLSSSLSEDVAKPNRSQRQNRPKPRDPYEGLPVEVRLAMEIIPTVPHSTVASILGDIWSTWSTLAPEHLVGTTIDLVLKHGIKVAGEWSMLGILDAQVEEEAEVVDEVDKVLLGITEQNLVMQATIGLAPSIRQVAGRPARSFGVTPLLIFREIAGAAKPS